MGLNKLSKRGNSSNYKRVPTDKLLRILEDLKEEPNFDFSNRTNCYKAMALQEEIGGILSELDSRKRLNNMSIKDYIKELINKPKK